MSMRRIVRQPAGLDVHLRNPVALGAHHGLCFLQVGVDVIEREVHHALHDPGRAGAEKARRDGGGADDDEFRDGRGFFIRLRRGKQSLQRRDDGSRLLLRDLASGYILRRGGGQEDGAGVFDALRESGGVVEPCFVDCDVGG